MYVWITSILVIGRVITAAGCNKLALFGCCAHTAAVAGHSGGTALWFTLVVLEDEEVILIKTPWLSRLLVRFHIAPTADGVAGLDSCAIEARHGLVIGTSAGGVLKKVGGEPLSAHAETGPTEHRKNICHNE